MKYYYDKKYEFFEKFDPKTGFFVRTGIYEDGKDTGVDPFRRSFPSLLDVGIMGDCKNKHNCTVGCYQGKIKKPNMALENFKSIIDQSKGKTWECALGGFGSPNEHEDFVEIVKYARENGVVPNYTTSGIELTEDQVKATKDYCGAVAVSWYKQKFSYEAIDKFLAAEIKTNIHYVLGRDSIDEAISLLENNGFPKDINAVIFLLYKPVGCVKDNILEFNDPRVKTFFKLIDNPAVSHKIGLDACCVPGVINFTKNIDLQSTIPCDGASFSAYITPDMFMLPCSFDNQKMEYATDLNKLTIEEAWESESFERFRLYHKDSCPSCKQQNDCRGGCPIAREINLCQRSELSYAKDLD